MVKTLNHVIGLMQRGGDDIAHLIPEVVVRLRVLRESPDAWARQGEWLSGLAATTGQMIAEGGLDGRNAAAWLAFSRAIELPEHGDHLGAVVGAAWSV